MMNTIYGYLQSFTYRWEAASNFQAATKQSGRFQVNE